MFQEDQGKGIGHYLVGDARRRFPQFPSQFPVGLSNDGCVQFVQLGAGSAGIPWPSLRSQSRDPEYRSGAHKEARGKSRRGDDEESHRVEAGTKRGERARTE